MPCPLEGIRLTTSGWYVDPVRLISNVEKLSCITVLRMAITHWLASTTRLCRRSLPARIVALVQNLYRSPQALCFCFHPVLDLLDELRHYKVRSIFHIWTRMALPDRVVYFYILRVLKIGSADNRGWESVSVPLELEECYCSHESYVSSLISSLYNIVSTDGWLNSYVVLGLRENLVTFRCHSR